jgi:hypothetical protein
MRLGQWWHFIQRDLLNDDNLYTGRCESFLALLLPSLGQLVAVTKHQTQQSLVEAGLVGVLLDADNGRCKKQGERQVLRAIETTIPPNRCSRNGPVVATSAEPAQSLLPEFPKIHHASQRCLIEVLAGLRNYPDLIGNLDEIIFIRVEPSRFEQLCVKLKDDHPRRTRHVGKEKWVGVCQVDHLGVARKSLPH